MSSCNSIAIYLNDHLAGATVAFELAKRSARANKNTPLGDFLTELAAEIRIDTAELEDMMDSSGVSRRRAKPWAAWLAEKAGRLKLNGQITGYSNLSRVEELEGLMILIGAKRRLWITLDRAGSSDGRHDLAHLIARSEAQLEELERNHDQAARRAFHSE